jgi:signal transduction histidine kinase
MNSLRIRFATGFSILFTVFLAIALLIVYFSYADFRKEEFYKRLKDRALTTLKLLVEVEQINHDLLKVIDKNTLNSLYDEKIIIFEGNKIIYESVDEKGIEYNEGLLEQVKEEHEIHTTHKNNELVALYQEQNGVAFTIIASAFDHYGRRKMTFLSWTILIVYFAGLGIGCTATYFFVKRVIKPLESLNKEIQNINSANLDIRLKQSGQSEEVDNLSRNFNQVLERLQQSFSVQKNFVHYASHELRTPLTAMIGITENALSKKLDPAAYEIILGQLFQQQLNLTEITNSLLLLSDHKITTEHAYLRVRLDEILFRAVEIVQNLFPDSKIQVNIEGSTHTEEALMVPANEPLLLMAFNNLLKNAVQYSTNSQAFVTIRFSSNAKELEFRNSSSPLSANEEQLIFTPFYRASNATTIRGHGLGLSLVKQIAELHNATVTYKREDGFNVFYFRFANN